MDSPVITAIIAAACSLASAVFAAWVVRRNAKDSTEVTERQAFLDDVLQRVRELEAHEPTLRHEIEQLQKRNQELWGLFQEARDRGHKLADDAHLIEVQRINEIATLKEQHAKEVGELRECIARQTEQIRQQDERIRELERHVKRLEGVGEDDGA